MLEVVLGSSQDAFAFSRDNEDDTLGEEEDLDRDEDDTSMDPLGRGSSAAAAKEFHMPAFGNSGATPPCFCNVPFMEVLEFFKTRTLVLGNVDWVMEGVPSAISEVSEDAVVVEAMVNCEYLLVLMLLLITA
jgi:hypothetical protein